MMIHLHLTAEQREEVQRVSRHAVGRVALRAHMVLLSDRAYSAPQIATIHDCGQDVMPLWLHRYDTEGRAGLDDESRSGLPRKGGDPLDLRNLQDQPPLDSSNWSCSFLFMKTCSERSEFTTLLL